MIRKLIVLVLIVGAGYFIYQRVNKPQTEEDRQVAQLRDRYAVLVNKFTGAMGRAGNIGIDTTFDIESAITQLKQLRVEVTELRRTLAEERAIGKADELADKITQFFKKNDITGP
jgi:ABC-type Na+ efflux pump permease subunit